MSTHPLRRSARIAAKAKSSAASNPPDVPATDLILRISIPVRHFPACSEAEKRAAIDTCRQMLMNVDQAEGMSDKAAYAAQLYRELIRQPILVAMSLKFRETTISKAAELRAELNAVPCAYAADELEDALNAFDELIDDLQYHPWYKTL